MHCISWGSKNLIGGSFFCMKARRESPPLLCGSRSHHRSNRHSDSWLHSRLQDLQRLRPLASSRYAHLYNFDVQFAAAKGLVGMKLEREGETSEYNGHAMENAIQGTWFFLTQIGNGAAQQ